MSAGRPTKLVRDGGTESYDPPPDLPLPGVLVPVESDSGSGEAGQESGYSNRRAGQAALPSWMSPGGTGSRPRG